MFIFLAIACLLVGHAIWWVLFGIECTINGAMRGGLDRPYIYLVEDAQRLMGWLPLEEGHPGWWYFIFMHCIIPLSPLFVLTMIWMLK